MVRKVASADGMKYYGLPMGAPITADAIAKARVKNGGKPAPRGASKQASFTRTPTVHRSTATKAAAAQAAAARKVSPEIQMTEPPRRAPKGPAIKTGSATYGVDKDSKTWSRPGSPVKYNVDGEGNLRVLTPQGEANLDPAAEMRVKSLMVKERASLEADPHHRAGQAAEGQSRGGENPITAERTQEEERRSADQSFQDRQSAEAEKDRAAKGLDSKTPKPEAKPDASEPPRRTASNDKPADSNEPPRRSDRPAAPEPRGDEPPRRQAQDDSPEAAEERMSAADKPESADESYENNRPRGERKPERAPERIADSKGESFTLTPQKMAAMRQSPLTGKHVDENGEFTPERKALHDKIISDFLDGVKPSDNPVQYMNGGGPASGKGTMTRGENAKITGYPETHVVDDEGNFVKSANPGGVIIDPDQLKLSLPEAKNAVDKRAKGEELTEDEKQWARNLHDESSYLGKRLSQAALDRGVNVVLDGVNDGSTQEVLDKVKKARDAGYSVEANYIYTDPEEALKRAKLRGQRSGRVVPDKVILEAYQNLPGIFDDIKDGVFDKVRLFDNNGTGAGRLIAEGTTPASGAGDPQGSEPFHFVADDGESVYERFLESAALARLLDEEGGTLSGADRALQENLRDMVSSPMDREPR